MTTPTGAGERRGLPRNLHWIITGIVMVLLMVVVLNSAQQAQQTKADRKTEQQDAERKQALAINQPVDPRAVTSIRTEQEEKVVPALEKLPAVPEAVDGKQGAKGNGAEIPRGNLTKEEIAEEQKRVAAQERVAQSDLIVLKGKAIRADETAMRASAMTGTNLGQANKAREEALLAARDRAQGAVGGRGGLGGGVSTANPFGSAAAGRNMTAANGAGAGNASARNEQWLQGQAAAPGAAGALHVEYPASQNVVMQGAVVPVVLVTAINSDMPGQIVAMATSDVYDSISQTALIIPRATKFYGLYNSDVQIGQERALAAFQRMVRPDGSYVNLQGMPAADSIGQGGIPGDVNNHFIKMFGSSFMTAGLAHLFDRNRNQQVVVTSGTSSGNSTMSGAAGEILVDIAKRAGQRNSNIPPTITVDAGERFVITVTRDIDIPPYRGRLPGQ